MDKIILCRISDGDDRIKAEIKIQKELSTGEWEVKTVYGMPSDPPGSVGGHAAQTLVVVLHKVRQEGVI